MAGTEGPTAGGGPEEDGGKARGKELDQNGSWPGVGAGPAQQEAWCSQKGRRGDLPGLAQPSPQCSACTVPVRPRPPPARGLGAQEATRRGPEASKGLGRRPPRVPVLGVQRELRRVKWDSSRARS